MRGNRKNEAEYGDERVRFVGIEKVAADCVIFFLNGRADYDA